MARENFVLLHGQIQSKPKIYQSTDGNLARAILAVKVLRRPYLNGNGEILGGRLHIDCPIIMSGNEDLIRKITQMQQGDMVDIRAQYAKIVEQRIASRETPFISRRFMSAVVKNSWTPWQDSNF